jgi:hypothetical protein
MRVQSATDSIILRVKSYRTLLDNQENVVQHIRAQIVVYVTQLNAMTAQTSVSTVNDTMHSTTVERLDWEHWLARENDLSVIHHSWNARNHRCVCIMDQDSNMDHGIGN